MAFCPRTSYTSRQCLCVQGKVKGKCTKLTNWVSSSIKSIPQNITGQLALTSHWLDYFTWPHLTAKFEVNVLLGHHEQNWDLVSKEDKDNWWVSKQQCLPREFSLFSPVYSLPPWEKSSQSLAIAQSPRDQLWTVWEVMDIGVKSVTTESLRTDRESRLLLPRERKLNKGTRRTSSWPGRAGRDQVEGWNRNSCWLRLPVLRGSSMPIRWTIPFDPHTGESHCPLHFLRAWNYSSPI